MPVQVTIIGLGQIGASIGQALAQHKASLWRVGIDKKVEVEREALKKDAVDRTEHNLPNAVKGARMVVLCLPISQVRETLEAIAPDLGDNAVVLDTSPVKSGTLEWARELLPQGRHYVGLVPAINPEALHDLRFGTEAAGPNLFAKGTFLITAPHGVPESALLLAMDFVRLLGAQPLLSDSVESDGLMAAVHLLPQLTAVSLLNATLGQPGWQEARKMAGRSYAIATSGVAYQDEVEALCMASLQDRANVVHALDVMIAAMRGLRDDIEKGNQDDVAERLESALHGRQRWLHERLTADWLEPPRSGVVDIPSFMERLLGSAIARKPSRK